MQLSSAKRSLLITSAVDAGFFVALSLVQNLLPQICTLTLSASFADALAVSADAINGTPYFLLNKSIIIALNFYLTYSSAKFLVSLMRNFRDAVPWTLLFHVFVLTPISCVPPTLRFLARASRFVVNELVWQSTHVQARDTVLRYANKYRLLSVQRDLMVSYLDWFYLNVVWLLLLFVFIYATTFFFGPTGLLGGFIFDIAIPRSLSISLYAMFFAYYTFFVFFRNTTNTLFQRFNIPLRLSE